MLEVAPRTQTEALDDDATLW